MNAKPLVWGLEKRKDILERLDLELYFDVPSKLCQMFDNGLLDVALLPAVSYFEDDKYRIIPGVSISTRGMVESVNLFLKKDVNRIKEVALDTSSRTSRALAAIILKKRYGLNPDFTDWDNGLDIDKSSSGAVLLIGDNAMKFNDQRYKVLDLGNEWYKLTRLPFVFAFWVTRCGTKLHGLDKILQKTKEDGIKAIDEIAAIEAERLNFSKEKCLNYLAKSIRYDLGKSEVKGLEKFYEYALEMGLINQGDHAEAANNIKQDARRFIKFYRECED